jgi:hypothetical protein
LASIDPENHIASRRRLHENTNTAHSDATQQEHDYKNDQNHADDAYPAVAEAIAVRPWSSDIRAAYSA